MKKVTILFAMIVFMAVFVSCSNEHAIPSKLPKTGEEGADCYPNGTCNEGLECFSGLCVDPNEPGMPDKAKTDKDVVEITDEDMETVATDVQTEPDEQADTEISDDATDVTTTDEGADSIDESTDVDSYDPYTNFPFVKSGIHWSSKFKIDNWEEAHSLCEGLDGRMPTLTELRKLVINCEYMQWGGACKMSDECSDWNKCFNSAYCNTCQQTLTGEYSVFGDLESMLSSTFAEDRPDMVYRLGFSTASIGRGYKNAGGYIRCVKD